MRLRGYTDSTDFHLITLVAMMLDRDAWSCEWTWTEWRLSVGYIWYDCPMFYLQIGPLWVGLD